MDEVKPQKDTTGKVRLDLLPHETINRIYRQPKSFDLIESSRLIYLLAAGVKPVSVELMLSIARAYYTEIRTDVEYKLAKLYHFGAIKYTRNGWRDVGVYVSLLLEALWRHESQRRDYPYNHETYADKDGVVHEYQGLHVTSCLWQCIAIITMLETKPEMVDVEVVG